MRYISTRGQSPPVSFLHAVLAGMAPDGGLYVPEEWPALYLHDDDRVHALSFGDVAGRVLEELGALDEVQKIAWAVYGDASAFPMRVAPLVQIGPSDWMLELFHGPSLSFKDIALQLIGPLYDYALERGDRRLTVVCATSGDTGGAAVEALKGKERIDLFVLTPRGRVSDVQRRFMTTSAAENVHVAEIDGDFDACQRIAKALFADAAFAARAQLSAINSINWARIAAQSVYYHAAANHLPGPIDFFVPTGNFGNAYSGWVAKQMGGAIGEIRLATNANDILARAINEGRYERARTSSATLSPAMDIQVASNFERILFEALDRDADHLLRLYQQFAQADGFDIPKPALARIREDFAATSVNDPDTIGAMEALYDNVGYVACPHTAVGWQAIRGASSDRHSVTLATANPAKFPDTVERATGVRPQLPARCADLFQREEKFDSLPADAEAVKHYISERSRAWS